MARWIPSRRILFSSIAPPFSPRISAMITAAVFGFGFGCAGDPKGELSIVLGEETDTFSRAPAPTVLVVETIDIDGNRKPLATANLPTETLSLGDLPRSDVGAIAVTARDGAGTTLVRGETLLVQWGALELSPLEIFAQRTGELARMPRGPAAIGTPMTALLSGRYVVAATGRDANLYDLLSLRTVTLPSLPRPAESVASFESTLLVMDAAGADQVDLSSGITGALVAPTGGTWAEIAGGQTIAAPDGTQFVVGATRAVGRGATSRILVISTEGTASFASLISPREGACAAWVSGRGLVVVGGRADGAGVEVLATGTQTATPLAFPADPVHDCGATALDGTRVLVAGGTGTATSATEGAKVRVVDLACSANCAPLPWPAAVDVRGASAITLGPDAAFVAGADASGNTHAYRVSSTSEREVPLRIPRRGAKLVRTPMNTAVVVGGAAGIEQYVE